ncbi:hypothetical protein PG985_000043 [Apiospora marii]
MLCGTAAGAPPVSAAAMASRLAENAKVEVIFGQAKVADLNGVMSDHRSLPSLVGATSTTLRSVGIVLVFVAVVVLGKTACFPSARLETLARDVVQGANHIEEVVISHHNVVSASQGNLSLDTSVVLSASGEESGTLGQLLHNTFPSPSNNADSRLTLVHDPNFDVHLTGSQFGLDGLSNITYSARIPSDESPFVTSPSVSVDADLEIAQLHGICKVVDSYRDIDFDFTVDTPRDDDSVSVASMAAVFDEDESNEVARGSSSVV